MPLSYQCYDFVPLFSTNSYISSTLTHLYYNPFSSSFHFALYSFSPFTYLERKMPFLHKYFLSFDLHCGSAGGSGDEAQGQEGERSQSGELAGAEGAERQEHE